MPIFTRTRERLLAVWWVQMLSLADTEPVEFAGGVLKVLVGVWLLMPFSTFSSSPTFAALTVLPEWAWALALIWLGSWHLIALRRRDRPLRKDAATVAWIVWFSFSMVFLWTNPPALGWLPILVFGFGQLWVSVRLQGRRAT